MLLGRGIKSWKNPRVCLDGVQSGVMAIVTEADAQSSWGDEGGRGLSSSGAGGRRLCRGGGLRSEP